MTSFHRPTPRSRWRVTGAMSAAAAIIAAGGYLHTALPTHHQSEKVSSVAAVADAASPGTAQAGNPDWTDLDSLISGSAQTASGDAVSPVLHTGHLTGDDGIVLLRVFIPAQNAAGGLLLGDNRGFSDGPSEPFRAELAWNTATGDARLVVTQSSAGPLMPGLTDGNIQMGDPIPALPITVAPQNNWTQAFAVRDENRSDNRIGIDPDTPADRLHAQLSLLNPLTNNFGHTFGAWTVDQDATISRTAPGSYTLVLSGSNGYPAIEAYYYPHYSSTASSAVIAKRSVEPAFLDKPLDAGGGEAALDANSSVDCTDTGTGLVCQNTVTATTTIDPGGVGTPTTITSTGDSWTTPDQQSNAM
ncbi:hypothetical protein [Streptomyces fuscichromogenes]|uniref:Uncharacterized protein n=1 Tax=Streptomyces fuscichromogenes TaxID=1324013 RepID=A0A917XIG1_9ACTN|nr:hypothetical protein [Streptomyces fuscichromogenes]GGN29930.1 hypothetical protein GCM10011578_066650 [Streptomyces fuscichromogenes]